MTMTATISMRRTLQPFSTDEQRWQAVRDRDERANGRFVCAVRTTGVFCRPTCSSRLALRENVEFFPTSSAAQRAGFRACKRCQPDVDRKSPDAEAIARACRLMEQSRNGHDAESLAAAVGMRPSKFHRTFKSLTGLTPKAYAIAQRSQQLRTTLPKSASVGSAVHAAGFNSTGRFYETSARSLGMTPRAFRAGGSGETIQFTFGRCSLGLMMVATTERGICFLALGDDRADLTKQLQAEFPNAALAPSDRDFDRVVAKITAQVDHPSKALDLPLDVRGTAFQHRVWKKLTEIPRGKMRTYTQIARSLGKPNAIRAVARACATNPVSLLIPCHRVVRTDGSLAGYRWGIERKALLLKAERNSSTGRKK
jgi:AraC family transcriptional regulator of adaptative response/methylated-DNA-[protein]-cysteine methyltransferase